jgi:hypothetical protein
VDFIPRIIFSPLLNGIGDLRGFVSVDTASLVVPNVPSAGVSQARELRRAANCLLFEIAFGSRIRQFLQSVSVCKGVHFPALPREMGDLSRRGANKNNMILLLSNFQVDEMSEDEGADDAWTKFADIESNARLRNEVELFMMQSGSRRSISGVMPSQSQSDSSTEIMALSSGSTGRESGAASFSERGAKFTGTREEVAGFESCELVATPACRERGAATVCDPSNVGQSSIPLLFNVCRFPTPSQELELIAATVVGPGGAEDSTAAAFTPIVGAIGGTERESTSASCAQRKVPVSVSITAGVAPHSSQGERVCSAIMRRSPSANG